MKPAVDPPVVTHTNRMGDTYCLHEGKTKTGKPRYFFAKSVREGALSEMPPGLEVSASINGVGSVRRVAEGAVTAGAVVVPASDVKLVEAAVARHAHLRGYMVRVLGNAIVIFEPDPKPAELREPPRPAEVAALLAALRHTRDPAQERNAADDGRNDACEHQPEDPEHGLGDHRLASSQHGQAREHEREHN